MMVDYLNPISLLALINTCKWSFFCAHPQQNEKVLTDTGICAHESIAGFILGFSETQTTLPNVASQSQDQTRTLVKNKFLTGFWEGGDRVKTPSARRVTIKGEVAKTSDNVVIKVWGHFRSICYFSVQEKPLCAQRQLSLPS